MNLEEMTVEQLNALSDELDIERTKLMERKKAVHAARVAKLKQDHLDYWGVTQEVYDSAKAKARESGESLAGLLNIARAESFAQMRQAQAVKAGVGGVGIQAVKE